MAKEAAAAADARDLGKESRRGLGLRGLTERESEVGGSEGEEVEEEERWHLMEGRGLGFWEEDGNLRREERE